MLLALLVPRGRASESVSCHACNKEIEWDKSFRLDYDSGTLCHCSKRCAGLTARSVLEKWFADKRRKREQKRIDELDLAAYVRSRTPTLPQN